MKVRDAGFHSQETVIYIAASQLIRHPFILRDIDSLLGRGEVPGLFSTKEKNELNEVKQLNHGSKQLIYDSKNGLVL